MTAAAAAAELELARRLADAADALSLQRFGAADLAVQRKADHTPVTDADRRIEQVLRDMLRAARPQHAVVGEEYGTDGDAAMRWYIDPIDGTANFARGTPVWATLIALYDIDAPVCAVVSAPALRRRWWASAGGGAAALHRPALRVSAVDTLARAGMSCTDPRDFASDGLGPQFAALSGRCGQVRAFGDFWSHMLVAEGALEVGIEARVNPWDVAAVRLIVEEAGGRFTDLQGEVRIDGGSVITSNGVLHQEVVAQMGNTIPQ